MFIGTRTDTLGLVWLKAVALEAFGEECVDVELQRLKRVPLDVVLVSALAAVESILHDKLKTSEVVQHGNHQETDTAKSTE